MSTINELCFHIINCGSNLNGCINYLEELKRTIKESKNKRTLIKCASEEFAQFMVANIYYDSIFKQGKKKNFKYVNANDSIGAYVSSLMAQVGPENKISSFNTMIDTVLTHLKGYEADIPESGELISRQMVESILELPLAKDTVSLLANDRVVAILNIDYTCQFNSTCLPHIKVIINSRSNPLNGDENYQDYVFMHELGHLFHVYLTGDFSEVPESFGNVIKEAFGNDIKNISKEDLREVFADCFAIACAYGTSFEKSNPFIQMFRREDSEYIANYMKNLIEEEMRKIRDAE